MLVWKVDDGYFHSIDLHNHVSVLGVQVNIAANTEMKNVCNVSPWVRNCTFSLVHSGHLHVSNFHIDVVLLDVILLQQNNEFQLVGAILCQNLVARQRHLVLVSPAVERGQCVLAETAFSCEESKTLCFLSQEITAYVFYRY